MGQSAVKIPEKIFFKIGEVCELVGVQAHVLRYWETEFSMLAPQKNRSGQRTYRRRDVEIALRIKELLYDEKFTIAGAKKKLAEEIRGGSRPKAAEKSKKGGQFDLFKEEDYFPADEAGETPGGEEIEASAGSLNFSDETAEKKAAFISLAKNLNEILQILNKEENGKSKV
jgi:DNA-binding transcriptional MerR regulator